MKRIRSALALSALVLGAAPANAVYNNNIQGVLAQVMVYADGDYIYFKLQNQPASHPTCNASFFVIADTVPADRRKAILARLLTAYNAAEAIIIGYDDSGDCAHGYIRAHRVG